MATVNPLSSLPIGLVRDVEPFVKSYQDNLPEHKDLTERSNRWFPGTKGAVYGFMSGTIGLAAATFLTGGMPFLTIPYVMIATVGVPTIFGGVYAKGKRWQARRAARVINTLQANIRNDAAKRIVDHNDFTALAAPDILKNIDAAFGAGYAARVRADKGPAGLAAAARELVDHMNTKALQQSKLVAEAMVPGDDAVRDDMQKRVTAELQKRQRNLTI